MSLTDTPTVTFVMLRGGEDIGLPRVTAPLEVPIEFPRLGPEVVADYIDGIRVFNDTNAVTFPLPSRVMIGPGVIVRIISLLA